MSSLLIQLRVLPAMCIPSCRTWTGEEVPNATRGYPERCLNEIGEGIPGLLGGSADLGSSDSVCCLCSFDTGRPGLGMRHPTQRGATRSVASTRSPRVYRACWGGAPTWGLPIRRCSRRRGTMGEATAQQGTSDMASGSTPWGPSGGYTIVVEHHCVRKLYTKSDACQYHRMALYDPKPLNRKPKP